MPQQLQRNVVLLHSADNICVALRNLEAGAALDLPGGSLKLLDAVRMGHKIAIRPIANGGRVVKFGQTIGFAERPIEPGQWIHSHNLTAGLFERDYASAMDIPPEPPPIEGRTFLGFKRPDGRAGTRNYIAVISTVNCSASVSKYVTRSSTMRPCASFRMSMAWRPSRIKEAAACSTRASIIRFSTA